MSKPLFRSEVAAAKRLHSLGTIRVRLPRTTQRASVIGLVAAASALLFLCMGTYTRHDRVAGQLLPSAGLLGVTATGAGQIARAHVHEGEMVEQGQPLYEISTDIAGSAVGEIGAAINGELETQRVRLQTDIDEQDAAALEAEREAADRVTLLHKQEALVAAQCTLRERQYDSAQQLLDSLRSLASEGKVGKFEFNRQQALALDAQAQTQAAALEQLRVSQQLAAALDQQRRVPHDAREKRRDTERRIAAIDQERARNDAQRSLVVGAPRTGTVSGITAVEGQHVTTGERLLSLIPSGSPLRAELWVPSRDIGFLSVGTAVALRYHAYPYEKFGQHSGHVREVAQSALSAAEVSRLLGQTIAMPLYRVVVELNDQTLPAFGMSLPLRSNMTLDADILLERRRLVEWLFAPMPTRAASTGPTQARDTAALHGNGTSGVG